MLSETQLKRLRKAPFAPAGNRLEVAIGIAEISKTALAVATGFTPQYIGDVAAGRYDDIKVGNATKFADYFGCSIEDLFVSSRQAVAS